MKEKSVVLTTVMQERVSTTSACKRQNKQVRSKTTRDKFLISCEFVLLSAYSVFLLWYAV